MGEIGVPDQAWAKALADMGLLTPAQVSDAQARAAEARLSLPDLLVRQGLLSAEVRANLEKRLTARDSTPRRLGNYVLIRPLGIGAMGVVWLAEDQLLRRSVAVKLLPKDFSLRPQALERFRSEAQAAGKLNHLNIVTAFAVAEENGQHYFVMEYSPGENLEQKLKREGPFPQELTLDIAIQVAEGLEYAHAAGFIHRDIKPANIMFTPEGQAKILDLGLSKNLALAKSHETSSGQALGTPHYISPEQARGERNLDGRCDLYGLGASLYQLVTGRTLFTDATGPEVMSQHLNGRAPDPREFQPELSRSFVEMLTRCLAKHPSDRYESAGVLRRELERLKGGLPPLTPRLEAVYSSLAIRPLDNRPRTSGVRSVSHRSRRTTGPLTAVRRHRLWIAGGAGALLLAVLLLVLKIASRSPREDGGASTGGGRTTTKAAGARTAETAKPLSPREQWIRAVRALPAEEQVRKVVEQLRLLNPAFSGESEHKLEEGKATELRLAAAGVTDLSPLEALETLRAFTCAGAGPGNPAPLRDLSPLRDLRLRRLNLDHTQVSDLGPLRGLPLRELSVSDAPVSSLAALVAMPLCKLEVSGTQVESLSFLRGLPLVSLKANRTKVADLEPLRGLPLEELELAQTGVSDLQPLAGLMLARLRLSQTRVRDARPLSGAPLRELWLDRAPVDDLTPLGGCPLEEAVFHPARVVRGLDAVRGLTTLKRAGHNPGTILEAVEFWRRYDAGAFGRAQPDGSVAFRGHTYKLIREGLDWRSAAHRCQNWGGHLATITSPAEQELLAALVPPEVSLWIGLTDREMPERWTWITGEPLVFSAWAGKGPQGNTCAALTPTGEWRAGEDKPLGFFCEWSHAANLLRNARFEGVWKDEEGKTIIGEWQVNDMAKVEPFRESGTPALRLLPGAALRQSVPLPAGAKWLLLSARLRTEGARGAQTPKQVPRVTLEFTVKGERQEAALEQRENLPWLRRAAAFPVPAGAETLEAGPEFSGAAGRFEVEDLLLAAVEEPEARQINAVHVSRERLAAFEGARFRHGDFELLGAGGKPRGWALSVSAKLLQSGGNHWLQLNAAPAGVPATAGLNVLLSPRWKSFTVKARLRAKGAPGGSKPEDAPRLEFAFLDQAGAAAAQRPKPLLASSNADWKEEQAEFAVPSQAFMLALVFTSGSAGALEADDLRLEPRE